MADLKKILAAGTANMKKFYKANPKLHKGQAPKIAVVGCSDSRVPTDVLFNAKPGELFTLRNIGNSLEDESNPKQLSEAGKAFITYAHHLGVETLVILAHGKCGCIANACSCASGHAHGHGLEGKILKQMGDQKRYAVKMVGKSKAEAYVCEKGLCDCGEGSHPKSVEIAHGQHMAALANAHLKKLKSKMKVVLGYFDIAACEMYVMGDKGKFVKVKTR